MQMTLLIFYICSFIRLFSVWLGKMLSKLRSNTAIMTDERIRLMNEVILGIQMIKIYTWEIPFAKFIEVAKMYVYNIDLVLLIHI